MSADVTPGGVLDGKYVLLGPIGGGRFGTVYRAMHIALQKPVAVKVLHAGDELAARDFEQFRVEAEALGRLNHPHIVSVTDFGVDPRGQGTPYLVMELVEGRTLEEVAASGPVDPARAAPWIAQIAAALDHAHAGGVVHGDLSPHNVLLVGPRDEAVVKVIDFGLARLVHLDLEPGDAAEDALALRVAGTPAYAAPERLRGEPPSAAADAYALAALTYRLVAGRPPFSGDARTVMQARLTREPDLVSAIRPEVSALDAILARGLARTPAERPAPPALASEVRLVARTLTRARWRRREAPRRLALAALAAVSLAAIGPVLADADVMQRLEDATQDVRFALSPPHAPDPRLLLVSIDDESLDEDATPLAARADEFASVLDEAVTSGAAVVALDLLLPQAWAASRPFGDFVLARSSHLVLGLAADETSVVGPESIDPLVAGALGPDVTSRLFGLVTHVPASDGVVRRSRTAVTDREGEARPTLAGRVFDLVRSAERAAVPPGEDFVVDYTVDAESFPRLGWRQFAESVRAGERFDGRVLLVGAEFTGSGDRHRVPGPRRLSREVSGLALQAVITDTLLQGTRLRDMAASLGWVLTGVVVFGAAACLLLIRRTRVAWLSVSAIVAALLAMVVIAFRGGVVAPLAVPLTLCGVVVFVAALGRARLPAPPE